MKKSSILSFFAALLTAVSCIEEHEVALSAAFESDATSAFIGEEITFDDISQGKPSLWEWRFENGDPETSNLTQPKVRWMNPGTYSVSLKISNKKGQDEIIREKMITISHHPEVIADFAISNTLAFDDEVITLSNLSKGYPETIKWTVSPKDGEPIILTVDSPSQTFPAGEYSVTLEVSNPLDSDCKTVESAFTVIDRYAVIAAIDAETTTTYAGGRIKFKDASTGNAQYWSWTFEGGNPATSDEQNPVVTYETEGAYKVSLKTYNDKYESFDEIEGYIHVLPAQDMVFLLPFDGSVTDYGPYMLTPSLYSKGEYEISYGSPVGNGGQSIKFPGGKNGQNYCVLQMPDELGNVFPVGSEMTVSVWTRLPEALSGNITIFHYGDVPGTPNASNHFWARFQKNNQLRCLAETTGKANNNATTDAGKVKFDDGNWHHICIVYSLVDGKRNLEVYADGVMVKDANGKDDKPTASLPYFIGCTVNLSNGAWDPKNMFTGWMDDYVLYKRGLNAAEVKAIYELYK